MKAKHVQRGEIITHKNTTEAVIETGTLVLIGTRAAVAVDRIGVGEAGSCMTNEVFAMKKDNAAIAQGAKVYYDAALDAVTASDKNSDEEANTEIGYAFTAAAATDEVCNVKLLG